MFFIVFSGWGGGRNGGEWGGEGGGGGIIPLRFAEPNQRSQFLTIPHGDSFPGVTYLAGCGQNDYQTLFFIVLSRWEVGKMGVCSGIIAVGGKFPCYVSFRQINDPRSKQGVG